jgi:accessory colonization factor AcfC
MLLQPNTLPIALTLSIILPLTAQADVFADRLGQTDLYNATIEHAPSDGVVKLYGAGGPHTAFRQVADVWEEMTGNTVEVVAGSEADWTADAQADADILWGTAEQAMTAFLLTYPAFDHHEVEPIYLRPAVIAVKAGNPMGIESFEDLLADGLTIIVTEGAGVYNTSGTGVWEDVAGRLGNLNDISQFRSNIVAYALGSGASYQQFVDQDADAWITWPNWPITKDDLEMVKMSDERVIYRDVSVVISPNADPEAQQFLDFLITDEAQEIMATEGWQR